MGNSYHPLADWSGDQRSPISVQHRTELHQLLSYSVDSAAQATTQGCLAVVGPDLPIRPAAGRSPKKQAGGCNGAAALGF